MVSVTRYWKWYFWTALGLVVLNFWGVIMPLGVEGFPIQKIGFPSAFWSQVGTETYFRPIRLVADIVFALFACHGIGKWAERQEGW